jgi:protein SCO1
MRTRPTCATLNSMTLLAVALCFARLNVAHAQQAERPADQSAEAIVNRVGFDQNLDAQLPTELLFRDDTGRSVHLGELLTGRPMIIAPVYYRCPMLCNQVLNALTRALKPLALTAGTDFDVIAISIDPDETPELAAQKKAAYLERYDRPGSASGWHFLTGPAASIEALTRTIGFRYTYNPSTKLYSHAAGIVVATPDGRIARYFYGIDYAAKELQQVLKRAAAGQIGSPIGRLLLLCYDYDSATGKYTLSILRLLRVLGTMTALALGGLVLLLFHRERTQRRAEQLRDHLASHRPASVVSTSGC